VKSPATNIRRVNGRLGPRWAILALFASWAAGCDLPGRPKAGDREVSPEKETNFSVLFRRNCVGCHGANGKWGPAPPLNDKLFLSLIPDAELRRVIAQGRPGTPMPAFGAAEGGHLSAEQVNILADGIKPRWSAGDSAPRTAPPYVRTQTHRDASAGGNEDDGMMVFAMACASCHGDHGQGRRQGGDTTGKSAGAINDPDFLALISDQALRRYVITGRPDLGMPDYADRTGRPSGFKSLTDDDVANVVALLASWREGGSASRKESGR
jgi:cytochrome c oxidase cbb3-type subunit III